MKASPQLLIGQSLIFIYHVDMAAEQRVRVSKKHFFGPPNTGEQAKNLHAEPQRLTLSCRVTYAWSEGVDWYNRGIVILLRKTKT